MATGIMNKQGDKINDQPKSIEKSDKSLKKDDEKRPITHSTTAATTAIQQQSPSTAPILKTLTRNNVPTLNFPIPLLTNQSQNPSVNGTDVPRPPGIHGQGCMHSFSTSSSKKGYRSGKLIPPSS